jgi:hypothetical protein
MHMASDRDNVTLIGSNLSEGDTIREVCPRCGGGTSGERSLSVSRKEGHLIWYCFRAKCNFKGATGSSGVPQIVKAERKADRKRKMWDGKTYPVPDDVVQRISDTWNMAVPDDWWWTTDYGGRIAMSIRGPKFNHRGWVLRSIVATKGAKALTYVYEGEQGLSWYKTSPHRGTILVEDIPSAIRASRYVNSVALLGTGVGIDRAIEIAENAPRPLVLALDQDATAESFRWARRYALLWGDIRVQPLKVDIKNMEEKAIEELLEQDTYNRIDAAGRDI